MNSTTTNDCSTAEVSVVPPQDDSARCQYRFSNGKRCQLPGLESQSGFCSRHFRPSALSFPYSPNDSEDLSADLLPELTEFSSILIAPSTGKPKTSPSNSSSISLAPSATEEVRSSVVRI